MLLTTYFARGEPSRVSDRPPPEAIMSDTQAILRKIAALRQRLDEAQATPGAVAESATPSADPLHHLAHEVAVGARHNALIDSTLEQLAAEPPTNAAPAHAPAAPAAPAATEQGPPRKLTARGARLLH